MLQNQSKSKDFPLTTIMEIPFSKFSLDEVDSYLARRLKDNQITHVVTANPEIVMYAEESLSYKQILKKADIIVPDGIGIVYASRIQKDPVAERVAGYDLLHRVMYHANLQQWKVYLLGAKEEVNALAYERLNNDYPNARLVGRHNGYFTDGSEIEKNIINEIKQQKPDILFVALGFPRQEEWISLYQTKLKIPFAMGIGGSFDILSGKIKRAPKLWQKLGIEWLYRIIKTPSRWKRVLVLPKFLIKVVVQQAKK